MAPSDIKFSFYLYYPSVAAAASFVALFAIVSLIHFGLLIRYRVWYFIPFVIGTVCESIGYVGRAVSATQSPNWTTDPYIVQSLLILIAPTLFSASIYMILGRLIRLIDGERHSVIPTHWLTKIFVTSDVLSFLIQGGGGGFLATAKNESNFETGEDIIVGGLFVQLIGFGTFLVVTAIFHHRILRSPTSASQSATVPWRRYIWVLYFVSAMILIRSIFRIIEYIQGYTGTIQSSEVWLYVFDTTLMFLATVSLIFYHPSRIINNNRKSSPHDILLSE